MPTDIPAWATSNIDSLEKHDTVKFDSAAGDTKPPLNAMGASEKKDGSRLVLIGCPQFAFNTWLEEPDPEIARARHKAVARFPANGDLFMNSIFWLSKQDTMIAISPAAMQVPRIADMTDGALMTWRNRFCCSFLPALALAAGIGVYFSRRD